MLSIFKSFCLFMFSRGKTTQVSRMWEGVQPVLKPYHSYAEAYRIQALCMQRLHTRIPEKSRSATSHGNAAPIAIG